MSVFSARLVLTLGLEDHVAGHLMEFMTDKFVVRNFFVWDPPLPQIFLSIKITLSLLSR
jgi:hypothetical protein